NGQSVQTDPSKSGFVGDTVELRCLFINGKPPVKISQVTWQKLINNTKQNVATANPALGVSVLPPFKDRVSFKHPAVRQRTPSSLEDTTIVFTSLRLSDEAAYICEYTTFPAGNRENMVNLTVFARPVTKMTLTSPTIVARTPKRKMPVATCMSANGKPPSVIKWDTALKGEATFQETRNPNGTVTVRSNYIVLPSRETHRQKLTCIVTYRAERFTDSVILNVQYEPEVKIEGFDGNWYLNRPNVQLTCNADANPPVTVYQWKLMGTSPGRARSHVDQSERARARPSTRFVRLYGSRLQRCTGLARERFVTLFLDYEINNVTKESKAEEKTVMGRDTGAGVTDKRGRPQQQCRADTKCVLKGPLGATLEVITVLLQNISIQNNYGGTHTSPVLNQVMNIIARKETEDFCKTKPGIRLNGSLPNNIEIKNNTLFFKGPVTYELGGTYVCDATNSIGTRSGLVEVNVTDLPRPAASQLEFLVMCWGCGDVISFRDRF
ncbi:Nectin-1, partial [Anabarilius grahami]